MSVERVKVLTCVLLVGQNRLHKACLYYCHDASYTNMMTDMLINKLFFSFENPGVNTQTTGRHAHVERLHVCLLYRIITSAVRLWWGASKEGLTYQISIDSHIYRLTCGGRHCHYMIIPAATLSRQHPGHLILFLYQGEGILMPMCAVYEVSKHNQCPVAMRLCVFPLPKG